MGLPRQLREQVRQGKEIEDQLRKEREEAGSTDKSQEEIDKLIAEISPEEVKPKKAEVTELHPKPEGGDPDPAPESKTERTDWKQKYSVLKGKYDAEVPRFSQENRELKDRLTALEAKLNKVKEEPKPEPVRTDFTPEEIADYGEDLMDVMGRKARQIVETEYQPKIDALTDQITTLKQELGTTGQRVAKQETNEVFAQLDGTVKNWRKINVDPDFHVWLDQIDPFSGETRKDLMLRAFNRKNAHQVRAFFDKYAEENATVTQDPTDSTPSGQGGTNSEPTLDLGKYVAPGAPKSGGTAGAPKDKRVWSNAEIGAFYSDVQKGRYKSRPDDKARIEADIVSATREGRIR